MTDYKKLMIFTSEQGEMTEGAKKDKFKTVTAWVNNLVSQRLKRQRK